MGKRKQLTEHEKGQIDAFFCEGIAKKEIARRLGRSPRVVRNYLQNPSRYGVKKSPGRPKKLSNRQCRGIIKAASNSTITLNRIRQENDLEVSKSTISRVLKRSPHIVRAKMNVAPRLKPQHITNRLEFARKHMDRNWEPVSFTVLYAYIYDPNLRKSLPLYIFILCFSGHFQR